MGIHGLTKLLSDECPGCMKELDVKALNGRKIAIDASMCMYQFLVAVRSGGQGQAAQMLTNDQGEVTSHIQGLFNRANKLLQEGIKPVFVFDGKPPTMKGGELAKRLAKRDKAQADLKTAEEAGATDDIDKFSKRLVKVTRQHNEDAKTLLRLMGVPIVDALSEAEAQCAELARAGLVYATATEDMDALTFATPKLLRRVAGSANLNQPVLEIDHEKMLKELNITHEQFVDVCILCGCDYTDSIRGIGPKKALNHIKQYGNIEGMLKKIDHAKFPVPPSWDMKSLKAMAEEEKKRAAAAAARAAAAKKAKVLAAKDTGKAEVAPAFDGALGGSDSKGEGQAEGATAEPAASGEEAAAAAEEEGAEAGAEAKMDLEEGAAGEEAAAAEGNTEEKAEGGAADVTEEDAEENAEDEKGEEGEEGADVDPEEAAAAAAAKVEEQEAELVPMFKEARRIFMDPEVYPAKNFDLKWTDPDEEGLTEFLVGRMQFNAERVASGITKLKAARKLSAGQKRMDSFFKKVEAPNAGASSGAKRKAPEPAKGKGKGKAGGGAAAKKGKAAAGGKKK